ncbi:glycosyltransferase family 4 protein [Nocardiopsis terrae]|uniref:glycosyltransferase family 4 protein n=1 Tax=Streptomyces sp. NPDC057554 TaxID=3350538 RepID=UPI0036C990DC
MAHYHRGTNRGGAELMLHALLEALAGRGHDVWLAATHSPDADLQLGKVNVIAGRRAFSVLRRHPWDVAITHLTEASRTRAWADSSGVPVVTLVHSTHPWVRADLAFGTDLAVFNTRWVAAEHSSRGWRGRHLVVHPPVWAHEHATTPGGHVTLVNLLPEKGSLLFYELAQRLPHVDFLGVVGGYEAHRQDVRQRANVTIQAHTARMREDVWARTRILLVPSDYESYGMVGPEAMCSGIPVIAHPTPGTREALGEAAVFLDRTDTDAWAAHLEHLHDPVVWERASKLAVEHAATLDPAEEIREFVAAVEGLVGC